MDNGFFTTCPFSLSYLPCLLYRGSFAFLETRQDGQSFPLDFLGGPGKSLPGRLGNTPGTAAAMLHAVSSLLS